MADLTALGDDRDDRAGDTENRNGGGVHRRLVENPRQLGVHVEAGVGCADEEAGTARKIDVQDGDVGNGDRESEDPDTAGDKHRPRKQRDFGETHARGAQRHHGGDDTDGAEDDRHHHHAGTEEGESDGVGFVTGDAVERTPTATGEDRDDGDQRAEHIAPRRRERRSGEGDVGAADLHRGDNGGETDEQRDCDHQHDAEAIQRPHLEVAVHPAEHVDRVGVKPLEGDQDTDHGEEEERQGAEAQPDSANRLVIAGGQPVVQSADRGKRRSTGLGRLRRR